MSDDESHKLYADFRIVARDADGVVVQSELIEDAGSVTMEDIKTNAVMNGVDEIEVSLRGVRAKRDDRVTMEMEATTETKP